MLTVICPECAGENVKSIEKWEVSKLKLIAPYKPMWVCKDPRCMHKWAGKRNPSMETNQVIGDSRGG